MRSACQSHHELAVYTAHLHVSAYLYLERFLQQTITVIDMAIARIIIINRRTTTPTATAITMVSEVELLSGSVDEFVGGSLGGSVGGSVGGFTLQPSGSKESITTRHVVSTCSCVDATEMGGVEPTQVVRREGRSTPGSAV